MISLKHFNELSKGISHFAVQRPGYFHHFIVAQLNATSDSKQIIEYRSVFPGLNGPGEIVKRNISIEEISLYIQGQKLFCIQAPNYPRTEEEIEKAKQRAWKRIGEKAYGLSFNNCEHFATYVLTGNATSEQLDKAPVYQKMIIDVIQTLIEFDSNLILLPGFTLTLAVQKNSSIQGVRVVGNIASEFTYILYRGTKLTKLYLKQYINKNDYEMEMRKTFCRAVSFTLGAALLEE